MKNSIYLCSILVLFVGKVIFAQSSSPAITVSSGKVTFYKTNAPSVQTGVIEIVNQGKESISITGVSSSNPYITARFSVSQIEPKSKAKVTVMFSGVKTPTTELSELKIFCSGYKVPFNLPIQWVAPKQPLSNPYISPAPAEVPFIKASRR